MTTNNTVLNATYGMFLYAAALFLIITGLTSSWIILALCLPVSLACLYIGYILNRPKKVSILNDMRFRVLNGVAILYLTLTIFFLVVGLSFGMSIEIMAKFIFFPFSLDLTQRCCVNGALYIRYVFYGLVFLIALFYFVSGCATRKFVRILGTIFGVISVMLWYILAIMVFLTTSLGH